MSNLGVLALVVVLTVGGVIFFATSSRKAVTGGIRKVNLAVPRDHGTGSISCAVFLPREPEKKVPVILYSPEWEGRIERNSRLIQKLAGEGFAVVAIQRDPGWPEPAPFDFSTPETASAFELFANEELNRRLEDWSIVLGALPGLTEGHFAGGRFLELLDPDRVGAMGYSFGGAVAVEALNREAAIRCAVDLDGTLFGNAPHHPSGKPLLIATDSMPEPADIDSPDPALRRRAEFFFASNEGVRSRLGRGGGWLARFPEAGHGSFADPDSPGADAKLLTPVNELVAAFFRQELLGENGAFPPKNSPGSPNFDLIKFAAPPDL